MLNNYALLQDLLPVLAKHGLDVQAVRVQPRRRLLQRRGELDVVQVLVDARVTP